MSEEFKIRLSEIRAILDEALRLNDNGQHGEALKKAHYASECLAAAYLAAITGQTLPPNDTTFEQFYETIQEPERHPELISRIEDIVGDVYVLRESYQPALLNETSPQDARQMIDCVTAMTKLTEEAVGHTASV